MSNQRMPPRNVPTLTEVVRPGSGEAAASASPRAAVVEDPWVMQEQLVHRVLQRVDATLDARLREAIAAVVVEQTRSLGIALREEIESAVRKSVAEALARELPAQGSPGQPRL